MLKFLLDQNFSASKSTIFCIQGTFLQFKNKSHKNKKPSNRALVIINVRVLLAKIKEK